MIGHVVLLGFGGPSSPADIRPFLDRVLRGRPISPQRYEDVVAHYERIGGKSPFNELTQRQASALQQMLRERGVDVPVRVAYKNAAPFIEDVAAELAASATGTCAVVLAAHQSEASWDKYVGALPNATYAPPFFEHPKFIRAHVERLRDALERLGKTAADDATLIFTAHSIPQAMADRGPYVAQLERSVSLIVEELQAPSFYIAYQSRSGSPSQQWLEPDVRDVLRALPAQGVREAIVAPVGFLCDHVEVLYDLDVDAASVAREAGVQMERVTALNDHPLFIEMLADLVQQCVT